MGVRARSRPSACGPRPHGGLSHARRARGSAIVAWAPVLAVLAQLAAGHGRGGRVRRRRLAATGGDSPAAAVSWLGPPAPCSRAHRPHDLGPRRRRRAAARPSSSPPPSRADATLGIGRRRCATGRTSRAAAALALFEDQLTSRQLDVACAGPEEDEPQLLHHRLGRPREQRGRRRAHADHRPGLPPLPVRRRSSWPAPASWPAPRRPSTRCSAWWPRATTRSPRAATRCGAAARCGSRRRRARSPATSRRRWAWPSASPAPAGVGVASGLPDDAIVVCSLRRRERQPRHRAVGDQHRPLRRAHGPADADPASCARTTTPASACRRPRAGSRRRSARCPTCATSLADGELDEVWDAAGEAIDHVRSDAPAGLPPPAHRAPVGACRQRCRAHVPVAGRDRRGRGARPAPPQPAPHHRQRAPRPRTS